jgi:hypothetical protein
VTLFLLLVFVENNNLLGNPINWTKVGVFISFYFYFICSYGKIFFGKHYMNKYINHKEKSLTTLNLLLKNHIKYHFHHTKKNSKNIIE